MTEDTHAGAILDLLADTLRAINSGLSGDQVVCNRLGSLVRADCGVTFSVEPVRPTRVVAHYPGRTATAELAAHLLISCDLTRDDLHLHSHPLLGMVALLPIVPDKSLRDYLGYRRVIGFSKAQGFRDDELALLERSRGPLAALWPPAARLVAQAPSVGEHSGELTARELQVLALLAQGLLARAIAARLSLSTRTVHRHLGNIYLKLGVNDRLVAVSLARSRGLI